MMDKKLTDADLKLWKKYIDNIISENKLASPVYKIPPVIKIDDYLNQLKLPELSKTKKKSALRYESKLDLHGMTRNEAHKALETFICVQKMRGSKCVLVITGKGHGKGDGLGILKRKVPLWLEALKIVKSHSIALPQDGGEGALYVYLK